VKQILLVGFLALIFASVASMAQVIARVAPPAPIVEAHNQAPHPGWVWIEGHHRWNGHRYVWVHGFWAPPPRRGAVWVPHRWEQREGGWVLIEGHWQ